MIRCKKCYQMLSTPRCKQCDPKPKKTPKRIRKVSKTNKNKPLKFTDKTKAIIFARDKVCRGPDCGKQITDFHHAHYGEKAEYCDSRNHHSKGIGLCSACHNIIHHSTHGDSQRLRIHCIMYVKQFDKDGLGDSID